MSDRIPDPEPVRAMVSYATCNDCRVDEHRDPPEWHTWADDEDIAHAKAIGGSDPTKSRCGCLCARAVRPEGDPDA